MAIEEWRAIAKLEIVETVTLLATAKKLMHKSIKAKDALHVASAIEGGGDFFITTDDKLLNKLTGTPEIQVVNPIDVIGFVDEYDK